MLFLARRKGPQHDRPPSDVAGFTPWSANRGMCRRAENGRTRSAVPYGRTLTELRLPEDGHAIDEEACAAGNAMESVN